MTCVRDSRYTPRGVVRSTDQREYRIARPLTARKGARPNRCKNGAVGGEALVGVLVGAVI